MHLPQACGQISLTYDKLHRPITHKTPLKTETFSYDKAGNLIKREVNDQTLAYRYDALYQLTSEPGHQYINDSLYNQVQQDGVSFTYNELSQSTQQAYDLNGNLAVSDSFKLSYDALNRLMSLETSSEKTVYTYDALDRRLSKQQFTRGDSWELQQEQHYLYVGLQEVGAANPQGKIEELRLLGKRGIPIAIEIQGTPYVPLHDHLGHCNTLLDMASNQVIETYDHTAFGLEQIFDADGNAQEGSINPWRYASKRFDPESGFIYFGKRYYVPSHNRWLTPDPLGMVDGVNLYPFLRNNPFRYIDPDGQFVVAVPFIMIAWGAVETAIATVTCTEVLTAITAIAAFYAAQKTADMIANSVDQNVYEEEKKEEEKKEDRKDSNQNIRQDPKNLQEQLTLQEALIGAGNEIMHGEIKDPKYSDEWQKKQHTHHDENGSIVIHYWEHIYTGVREGFKFKND
jgi:RHS repeat-associated protein